MKDDSLRLALAGLMIGLLAFSATAAARLLPRAQAPAETGAATAAGAFSEEALPAMAEQTQPPPTEEADDPAAGPFYVSLRVPDPVPGERLYLCDGAGCPLEEALPDGDGDAVLGPLPPGRYLLLTGEGEAGAFRLRDTAALEEARGRLWTDGELLYLERFRPGGARLTLHLAEPGWYTLSLWDRDGRERVRDCYVPEGEAPEADGTWTRTVEFRGLAPGLYTAARRSTVLGQVEVRAEDISEAELKVEN